MATNGEPPVGISKNIKLIGRTDLPGGGLRYVTRSSGIEMTFVNGEMLVEGGRVVDRADAAGHDHDRHGHTQVGAAAAAGPGAGQS